MRKLIEAIKAKTETEGLLNLLDEIPQTEKSYFMLTNDEGLGLQFSCQHYFTKSATCCLRLSYCRKNPTEFLRWSPVAFKTRHFDLFS